MSAPARVVMPRGITLIHGASPWALREVRDRSVHCVTTSPPYWGLRDYGCAPLDWPEVEYAPIWYLPPLRVPAMRCALGLEPDLPSFIGHLVLVFREVRRCLRDDGVCWVNLGSSYATGTQADRLSSASPPDGRDGRSDHKPSGWTNRCQGTRRSPEGLAAKQLVHAPALLGLALQADGWFWRAENIWHKPNPMPEPVTDRPTVSHEQVLLFAKGPKYFFDAGAISEAIEYPEAATADDMARAFSRRRRTTVEPHQQPLAPKRSGNLAPVTGAERGRPGDHRRASIPWEDTTGRRNARTVWRIPTQPFKGSHFATFPEELARRCLAAGTSARGCCPSCGAPARPGDAAPPACACAAAGSAPCVALDPFAGSGTVGAVARDLGLRAVLVEAQAAYLPLIERREIRFGSPYLCANGILIGRRAPATAA